MAPIRQSEDVSSSARGPPGGWPATETCGQEGSMAKFIILETRSCRLPYNTDLENLRQQLEAAMTQGAGTTIPLGGDFRLVVNGKACPSVILYDDGLPENAQQPNPLPIGQVTSMVN
jgi:hypothetical protein